MTKGHLGRGIAVDQGVADGETAVGGEKHACTERIARPDGSNLVARGQRLAPLHCVCSVTTETKGTFGAMDDHPLACANDKELPKDFFDTVLGEGAVRTAQLNAHRLSRLDFVESQLVHVFQDRRDDLGETVADFADDINGCLHAAGLDTRKHLGHARTVLGFLLVEAV